ncbi:MAG TPA: CBS domain-containing protein [Actinospica sp.]|jgi:CBS domain-containing protein|nr:CBS domain-containing protein [Actinospica sp.]
MGTASQFMNPKVESIPSGETVDVAAKRMRDADVGALLVTDEGGQLVGVITDRDIVTGCIASGHDPAKCPVSSLADAKPVTVDAEADLAEIVKTMGRSRVRRLPVTENGRLVGVLGVADLVKAATPDEIGSLVGKIVQR